MTRVRLAIVASFCFATCLAFLQIGNQGGALSRLEGQLLDLRFALRGEIAAPQDIVILAIDDAALEKAQAFPFPRSIIADAIQTSAEKGAQAIVLDLLLSGSTDDDAALKDALANNEKTALAISLTVNAPPAQLLESQLEKNSFVLVQNSLANGPNGILGPQLEFAEQAHLGHVNLRLDDDGTLRRFPVAVRHGDGAAIPALAVVAARLHAKLPTDALSLIAGETLVLGDRNIPLNRNNMAFLNHFGPRGTINTVSISEVASADLDGKLVFIGATAEGYRDSFVTPFDTALSGVEGLATLAANLLDQTTLRRDQTTWLMDAILAILGATVVAVAASRARPLVAALGSLTVWMGGLAALQAGFVAHLWLDAATMLTALTVGTLLGFAARWETNRRRALNLSRYQSPQLVEALANQTALEFDGRMQKAAILFVDLVDFTQRSAEIGSAASGKLLNRFHTIINDVAQHWNGVVSYTAGDGAMIIFGLPQVAADDAKRALGCANDLLTRIGADDIIAVASSPSSVRIGAHSGDVFATVLGEKGRSTPTVTGDVVNTASRLQEQAKTQGAILAMSDEIYQESGRPDFSGLVHAGPITLRGRTKSLDLLLVKRPAT
ncbi:MAG: CHASE2 domain-containing protein [Paracoccaceae bacterium]